MEGRLLLSTNNWKAAVSGNWEDASKWSLGHVPTGSEDVTITAVGTYAVSVHGNQMARIPSLWERLQVTRKL
jgi:hypothetical protein